MNLHEYQAKALCRQFGIPVPEGFLAQSVDDAIGAAKKLPGPTWVVKAQIHAGGRGKGSFLESDAEGISGVYLSKTVRDVETVAGKMLFNTLVTEQTGPSGRRVNRLYVEGGARIRREFYLSILVDRSSSRVAFVVSKEGGMSIEQVAEKTPDKVHTFSIDPAGGCQGFHGRKISASLGLEGELVGQCVRIVQALYQMMLRTDISLIEINPLVETSDGQLVCLDSKIIVDSNALFRQPEMLQLRDLEEEEPSEIAAAKHGLAYVKLDGTIGCMVNGAGLAMATMDMIEQYGGKAANFLDVGGGSTKEKVQEAFKIILSDKGVKGILVNIFGGIMRCDIIAHGIVAAAREVDVQVPMVVRLEGTNADLGRTILVQSGIFIIPAESLDDAAKKICSQVARAQ